MSALPVRHAGSPAVSASGVEFTDPLGTGQFNPGPNEIALVIGVDLVLSVKPHGGTNPWQAQVFDSDANVLGLIGTFPGHLLSAVLPAMTEAARRLFPDHA